LPDLKIRAATLRIFNLSFSRRRAKSLPRYGKRLSIGLCLLILITIQPSRAAESIKLNPDNPHYFLFRGQPTVLISVAEHYGAVVNLDFDYLPYLDELQAHGLNLVQIFPGNLPHDVVIPGVLTAGDLSALAAGLAPRPLALVGLVDGLNRAVEKKAVEAAYARTLKEYEAARARDRLVVAGEEAAPSPVQWLLEALNER